MKKDNKKKLLKGMILGSITGIFFLIFSVRADILMASSAVTYSNTSSGLTSTNVQGALDELFTDCGDYIVTKTPTLTIATTTRKATTTKVNTTTKKATTTKASSTSTTTKKATTTKASSTSTTTKKATTTKASSTTISINATPYSGLTIEGYKSTGTLSVSAEVAGTFSFSCEGLATASNVTVSAAGSANMIVTNQTYVSNTSCSATITFTASASGYTASPLTRTIKLNTTYTDSILANRCYNSSSVYVGSCQPTSTTNAKCNIGSSPYIVLRSDIKTSGC